VQDIEVVGSLMDAIRHRVPRGVEPFALNHQQHQDKSGCDRREGKTEDFARQFRKSLS